GSRAGRRFQKSSSAITTGNTTAIPFERQERTNRAKVARSHGHACRSRYRQYVMHAERKKRQYSTSFRSEIHATDSTCMGWIPKRSATTEATRIRRPESRSASQKTSMVFSVRRMTLVTMNGLGESGWDAFVASEIMVSG